MMNLSAAALPWIMVSWLLVMALRMEMITGWSRTGKRKEKRKKRKEGKKRKKNPKGNKTKH